MQYTLKSTYVIDKETKIMLDQVKHLHIERGVIYLYVLKLECEKYYVGISTMPQQRILSHYAGNGSKWTGVYKPKSIHYLVKFNSKDIKGYENLHTKKLVDEFGEDNVRGGAYLSVNHSEKQFSTMISYAEEAELSGDDAGVTLIGSTKPSFISKLIQSIK